MIRRLLLLFLSLSAATTFAQSSPEGIAFFEQKIRPILSEHCYECHSTDAKKLKANLYLDSKAGWEKGGDSGDPAIRPGNPEDSALIKSVRHDDPDSAMPPKKTKLPNAIIADLIAWVKMGAPDPRVTSGKTETKRADKSWWSLQPIAGEFAHQSIDGFLEAQLSTKELAFNPPADPRILIRRLTYDLTGLPPTPVEVDTFVSAHQADGKRAIEQLVDRLLASPRYGEHWGRHWLDVVRFGESNGFERNFIIDDLWPFRDYVIRSLNEDKPMNQLIMEHLAGDVIGKGIPDVEVGSAFLVAGPYDDVGNQDAVAQKNIRAATLDDMITTTGGAFLGLTLNCARCHNHKFDPIPTEDYYRMRSAFEGVFHGRRAVVSKEEKATYDALANPLREKKAALSSEKEALEKEIATRAKERLKIANYPRPKITPESTEESFPPVAAKLVKFVMRAHTGDPKSAVGARLTEFEVWSSGGQPKNVALASNGSKADGAKSSTAQDFPEAYGPQFCIDGKTGEQWFIGNPAELTITLAKAETIAKIVFSNAKQPGSMDSSAGQTPCEYEIQISLDGSNWQTVASSSGRKPWSEKHELEQISNQVATPEEEAKRTALQKDLGQLEAKMKAIPEPRQIWVGNHKQPKEPTFVHKGGDPMKPAESVVPASLNVLDRVTSPYALKEDAPEGERRVALAKWIVAQDNPLTPRVLANRIWHYHFGAGIVDTPSDFGFMGSRPTHPELLDYLASRLVALDWKLKPLHREILLSRAYLQSSTFRQDAAGQDKDSRLLWRFPPRRLCAEEVRDTLLAVAGKLTLTPMGGPGYRLYRYLSNNVSTYLPLDQHGPETYRRAVYHQNARASVVDVLSDFDLPDIAFSAPKRANTTTPLQALTLWNHSFTLDMANAFSERLDKNNPVLAAYSFAYQRKPSRNEAEKALHFIETHGLPAFCRALFNSNEILYLE